MLKKMNANWEETNVGFIAFLVAIFLPSVGVVIHCLFSISQGKALEAYNIVIMGHPVLTNLGATYLEVLIADAILILTVSIALYLRHRYYRDERDFMRRYKLKGSTGFSKDFKFSSRSKSDSHDSDHED